MALILRSTAFESGQAIPPRYSRDDENLSPPLQWDGAPNGTRSYVLIVEDPDAPSGTFRHWAVYNLPPERTGLAEGVTSSGDVASFEQGVNDFGNAYYDGPQPPKGHGKHHYHFRLAALDVPKLELPSGAKVVQVWQAAGPHMISEAELIGTYER